MANEETTRAADGVFKAETKTVTVRLDDIYDVTVKSIEAARNGEKLDRDIVRRATAVLKAADSTGEEATEADIDEALWADVQKDAEGVDVGRVAPSAKIADIAKRWAEDPAEPEVAPQAADDDTDGGIDASEDGPLSGFLNRDLNDIT